MVAISTCLALTALATSPVAAQKAAPPNWRGGGTGQTAPDPNQPGVDLDVFVAQSSHLGKVAGAGFHMITGPIFSGTTLVGFTFEGKETWIAANRDALFLTFTGEIFFTGDAAYPFAFAADLVAGGGTGRFKNARGSALMQGAFTGVPGEFYFSFEGTLNLKGK
jgi:hypothetical protein